jgi:hypothetical protein
MENYVKRDDCRLCLSKDIELVMPFKSTPIGDEYLKQENKGAQQDYFPLELSFCNNCKFVQLQNVVSPKSIYENYIYETSASLGLVEHFKSYALETKNRLGIKPDDFIIEFGSNDGTFLKAWQDLGMNVLGFEPAIKISEKSNARGVTTLNEFFGPSIVDSVLEKYGQANLILANNVLANIDDLQGTAKAVKSLLKQDGVFVFESGYMIDTFENKVIDNVYHEHLSYFSLLPLESFFSQFGLEVYDVQHVETKGGSARYFIQHVGGSKPKGEGLVKMLENERSLGYETNGPLKKLSSYCEELKEELISQLKIAKEQGKKIAGYGASVGVTTLLHYFEISEYLECLYDDNPIRDGLLSPGHQIPVKSSQKIYDEKPDLIVLLAWRYKDPILKRHQQFLDNGGKFILPLPNVEIVNE